MRRVILTLAIVFLCNFIIVGQSTINFTWEGAFSGNQAKWLPDAIHADYINVSGVNIGLTLIDPLHINTTTTNMSEFNDYTMTNTFFGRGNLAFQVKSYGPRNTACLQFDFSKPVTLSNFLIWDIDMLQLGQNNWSTYQDSVHLTASNKAGNVPLVLSKMSTSASFTIYGQSAKADFIANVNGNISHNDINGALSVESTSPIEQLVLCHANGSEDDGLSNSHAIKIPGFEFVELLGSIQGQVRNMVTNNPLPGSQISLLDQFGNQVYNKSGAIMQSMTGEDGRYAFLSLPMGVYKIVQINPPGYDSVSDVDGPNDNEINVELDVTNVHYYDRDFIETQASPLAATITDIFIKRIEKDTYIITWRAVRESNVDYYELFTSVDGLSYERLGQIKGFNLADLKEYNYPFYQKVDSRLYVKVVMNDLDGTKKVIGIKSIISDDFDQNISVFPNPAHDQIYIHTGTALIGNISYDIISIDGKVAATGTRQPSHEAHINIDVSTLPKGNYTIILRDDQSVFQRKMVKL
ncbi:MAG: T9SS type A sorting domain-containing protein [Saprospiraceae bacterium]